MSLEDPANKVRVPGHKGPHPEAYHQDVFKRLDRARSNCRTLQQCADALVRALQDLAVEIQMEGSRLNKLVTRTE
ncbi:AHH domain-containing protein [Archangium sp. miwbw1]|uniref:AHH domain-containing protein n=1 Tax=Archangium lansingense TaxID=2995310 RepID=A0ABT4A3Y0_9BACT|nr:AHH domain-containing protein [Archangium lansinium]MCY1075652.1 AHH domain-containing protein [Archangium lansinium]